jgi:TRAP-type uncharacterized transport system fused permease subunit
LIPQSSLRHLQEAVLAQLRCLLSIICALEWLVTFFISYRSTNWSSVIIIIIHCCYFFIHTLQISLEIQNNEVNGFQSFAPLTLWRLTV